MTINLLNNNIRKESLGFKKIYEMYKDTEKNVFQYKNSLLINGDTLEKNAFDKESFDLIITSPPYNVDIRYNSHNDNLTYDEYLDFSEKWMSNCFFGLRVKEGFV